MPVQEHFRTAFLEWIEAIKVNKASWRDHFFIDSHNRQSLTAYLMGYVANSKDILPENHAWIVTDYPELIGRNAAQTYENAVRVVRTRRQH